MLSQLEQCAGELEVRDDLLNGVIFNQVVVTSTRLNVGDNGHG